MPYTFIGITHVLCNRLQHIIISFIIERFANKREQFERDIELGNGKNETLEEISSWGRGEWGQGDWHDGTRKGGLGPRASFACSSAPLTRRHSVEASILLYISRLTYCKPYNPGERLRYRNSMIWHTKIVIIWADVLRGWAYVIVLSTRPFI